MDFEEVVWEKRTGFL